MKVETLVKRLETLYNDTKTKECEDLHNAIADILTEHKASIQNILYVLEIIKFELMQAKYKEILGQVKLTDNLPLPILGKKEEKT